jgi:hypothetical protein
MDSAADVTFAGVKHKNKTILESTEELLAPLGKLCYNLH